MIGIFKKLFGSRNDREIKKLQPMVGQINQHEQQFQSLSDEALRAKTAEWKGRLSTIEDSEALARALDELLPEAFAAVKNACRRMCRA